MFVLRLISLTTMLIFSSSAFAQRWAPFTSEDAVFRIMVPGGEFDIETVDFETEYGIVVPAHIHRAEDQYGTYTLTVVDYVDSMELHRERIAELDGIYLSVYGEVDARGSVAYFARMIRERAESVEYDNYHYIGRVDGHQLHTTNPDGTRTFAGLYLLESRLYAIEATIAPTAPTGGMFQQSFEFLDENGVRIMYPTFHEVRKIRLGSEYRPGR
jgi:hypothetical protein